MSLGAILVYVGFVVASARADDLPQCPSVDGKLPVYIPDKDCSKFWECSNGTPYLFDCPGGLHFNLNLNVCDWPYLAGCTGNNGEGSEGEADSSGETNNSSEDNNDNTSNENSNESNNNNDADLCHKAYPNCPAVDGEHPVYIPLSNCSQFCQCSNGLPYLHNCPDGLHFNPTLNVCDWPQDAGCANGGGSGNSTEGDDDDDDASNEGNTESDDNASNEGSDDTGGDDGGENEAQPCPETNTECPSIDGEYSVYIPLPNNCSQFCQCSNGLAYLHNCPDGLHFNPNLNVCDWPKDAGCTNDDGNNGGGNDDDDANGEGSEDSDNGDAGNEESSEDGDNDNASNENSNEGQGNDEDWELCPETSTECPAVDGEYPVYIPLPKNCSQFCQCSNGLAYLHNCPDGLHFNPNLNVCDWPKDAGCTNDDGNNGGGNDNDDANGEGSEDSDNGDAGNGESSEDGDNDNASNENTNESQENDEDWQLCPSTECPAVDGEYPVYIPLPKNCSQFCECSNGIAYLFNCPDGLHFNPILNVCDWPDVAGCSNDAGSGNSTESDDGKDSGNESDENNNEEAENDPDQEGDENTAELCPLANPGCPTVDGEYPVYISLANCSQFCQCSNGVAYLHNCPDNLHFNPVLNVCDWPYKAGCTSEGSNREENGSNEQNNLDIGDLDICRIGCSAADWEVPALIPLPNCSQFCECFNGIANLHSCPPGLLFNPDLRVCDWPDSVACEGIAP